MQLQTFGQTPTTEITPSATGNYEPLAGDLVDDLDKFFAPVQLDLIDSLIGEYKGILNNMKSVVEFMDGQGFKSALHYFIEGNSSDSTRSASVSSSRLFGLDGAVAYLNTTFWTRALALTDVYEAMPQARKDEWNEQIRNRTTPDFDEATVRSTMNALLSDRTKFFAERVDGIFRNLSGDHVTNRPEAFYKRFIIAGLTDKYGSIDYSRAGVIHDLRAVVARFVGRQEPTFGTSHPLLEAMKRRFGDWHSIDGGSFRMRLYKKGTIHCEVHPDIAWKLNSILATLYPMAIPPKFRTKPKAKPREFTALQRPLPFSVIQLLSGMKHPGHVGRDLITENPYALRFEYSDGCKVSKREAEAVLTKIGGVRLNTNAFFWFEFDYNPREALDEIITSGVIPCARSHQFYPTPESLADDAIALAGEEAGDTFLEPQAGLGGLACKMPQDRTLCIELSSLHCRVLRAKGFTTIEADFLRWATETDRRFSCVIMNPPFADGRALAHLQAASTLVTPNGRLVAILPASMKHVDVLPGWDLKWTKTYANEFDGTGVSVVMVKATRVTH
ncbi:DUF4942 domain-containing protein [Pseudomonas sp. LS-2]|uniref:DUF4942 domain-containing protein n=1 Tax=Pseudomonas sp. LS-2 TaxID=2315859 RepID=UPI000E760999|nr:DUF4942 domain-containing protein [Pseudomonas sp. LS-2]RJX82263.1 DUF4942 domain-containing protein [Pseudomonas sp. LS-2]